MTKRVFGLTRQVKFINMIKQVGIISILGYFTLLRKVQYDNFIDDKK